MATPAIARQRLAQQRLTHNPCATPEEVVGWLGAVQAQDYAGAKWALGLRMHDATDDVIEQAFTDGSILRTHVMRPTWHFVTPSDIRWLLELTAPRVNAVNAYTYRQLELDDALFARGNTAIAKALQDSQPRTRAELGAALAAAGIDAAGPRLGHLMMRAELDGIICSGPQRGKQFTYALLEQRAPQSRRLPRDEALVELIWRYYTGHGPATAQDFVWWSGLTMADAKMGLALGAERLAHAVIDSQTYWFPASTPSPPPATEDAFLLPTYDEFVVGFAGFDKARRGGREAGAQVAFEAPLVIDGLVVGSWRRTIKQGTVVIDVAPFAPLTAAEREAVSAAARRYGAFWGMPVRHSL
jgi:hypothetical protein